MAFVLAYQDVLVGGQVPPGLALIVLVAWTTLALIGGSTIVSHRSQSFAANTG